MFKASVVSAICHKPGDNIQCKIRFLHQVPIVNSLNAGIQYMFLCISFTSITCCVSLSMILLLACSFYLVFWYQTARYISKFSFNLGSQCFFGFSMKFI